MSLYEETTAFLRACADRKFGDPPPKRPKVMTIEGAQTSMLQWLRRKGHAVDFQANPVFTAELPSKPSVHVPNYLDQWHGRTCPYCGKPMYRNSDRRPTRDHKIPRCNGGKGGDNLLIVCNVCNSNKGGRSLEAWAYRLTALEDRRADIVWDIIKRRGA